jgi:hypothetical protein
MDPKHGLRPDKKSLRRKAAEWGFTALAIGPAVLAAAGNTVTDAVNRALAPAPETSHTAPARPPGSGRIFCDSGYDYDPARWDVPHPLSLAESLMRRLMWETGWTTATPYELPANAQHRIMQGVFYAIDANTAEELLRSPDGISRNKALRPLLDEIGAEREALALLGWNDVRLGLRGDLPATEPVAPGKPKYNLPTKPEK